jgi:hypothetical protein
MAGFRPSDWDDGIKLPIRLEKPGSFNFQGLLKSEHLIEFSGLILISIAEPRLLEVLGAFVLEYTFTGKIRGLSGCHGEAMVEYGVSRFKHEEAQTDEPLAILALVTFLEQTQKVQLPLARYLIETINTPDAAHRGIRFEPLGAYLLACAFSEPRRLSEVFEFVEGGKKAYEALHDERAELVALAKDGDDFQTTPLRITTNCRSSHVLGCSPSTAAETLKWLQDPKGTAFCFPANAVGPDLIFVLRLTSDGTVLRVCVQFKHTQELSAQASEKAIRTTNPFSFLSHDKKDSNAPTCSDPSMQAKMVEAIKNLGDGTKKAGPCGHLGVVISLPSVLDSNKLEEAAKGGPPLATVAVSHLEALESELGQAIDMMARAKGRLQGPDLKRKNSHEVEEPRPKRQKRAADMEMGGSR